MISQQFVSLHMFPQSKLLPFHPFYRDCIQDSPHQICSFLTFLLVHKILQYIETCLSQKLPREKGPCYHGQIIKDISSWRGGGIVARTGPIQAFLVGPRNYKIRILILFAALISLWFWKYNSCAADKKSEISLVGGKNVYLSIPCVISMVSARALISWQKCCWPISSPPFYLMHIIPVNLLKKLKVTMNENFLLVELKFVVMLM